MATILFVDDDEVERIFAREVLEPRGHRILFAGDGESALEIYRRPDQTIDVVVTDLAMPRLNGLRLIKALKEVDPAVQIIAASGVSADQLDMAEEFGALRTIAKPWSAPSFIEALDAALEADRTQRDWAGGAWDEVWPLPESPAAAPGAAEAHAPDPAGLAGVWWGEEHVFPGPGSPRGSVTDGRLEIRLALGDTALVCEHHHERNGTVRRRGLTLVLRDGLSGEAVEYDFVAGSTTPSVRRGSWDGALLRVEGPAQNGHVLRETAWQGDVMVQRAWTCPPGGEEPALTFEARYERRPPASESGD